MKFLDSKIYQQLIRKKQELATKSLLDLFAENEKREDEYTLENDGFLFDFSKNWLDQEVLQLFNQQSQKINLKESIQQLFEGKKLNVTENTCALHIALRSKQVNTQQAIQVTEQITKMKQFSKKLQSGELLGSTGKAINTIVNLGIGGSHLGAKMAFHALKQFKINKSSINFISHLTELESQLTEFNPETTLFIVCSKSFGTEETLTNATIAKQWLQQKIGQNFCLAKHLLAVTANKTKALEFGINNENIFSIWEWVGGRFSISSSMSLILFLAIGSSNFDLFLAGFEQADNDFLSLPFLKNIPVLMAWIGIWYLNFWNLSALAILPYAYELKFLPDYLQQLEMESNGKSVNQKGELIDYQTSALVFGQLATDSQHSFFQFFHQGTQTIPCDFVFFAEPIKKTKLTKLCHQKLMSHFLAQQCALAFGKTETDFESENKDFINFKTTIGNRPSSSFLFKNFNPKNLGRLVANYEHKVFVQGILWNIFSFDQWGVEYGKQMAKKMLPILKKEQQVKEKYKIVKQLNFCQF